MEVRIVQALNVFWKLFAAELLSSNVAGITDIPDVSKAELKDSAKGELLNSPSGIVLRTVQF